MLTRFPQFCDQKLEMTYASILIKKLGDLVDPPSRTVLRHKKPISGTKYRNFTLTRILQFCDQKFEMTNVNEMKQ